MTRGWPAVSITANQGGILASYNIEDGKPSVANTPEYNSRRCRTELVAWSFLILMLIILLPMSYDAFFSLVSLW